MNRQKTESMLREYFSEHGKILPEQFPCPVPQRAVPQRAQQRAVPQGMGKVQELNRYIDHTLLKQAASAADYEKLFAEARSWEPFSVCVPPVRIPAAVRSLRNSAVKTCTVVGFPWGYNPTEAKAAETSWAVSQGCDEIDMVISVGFLKDGNYTAVFDDIAAVVRAADGHLVKVILETAELSEDEIIAATLISGWAGAWFVKTSTGFASGGASVEAVRIMRDIAGDILGVKASGGIRNRDFAEELIGAGADRLGVSATGVILGRSNEGSSGY